MPADGRSDRPNPVAAAVPDYTADIEVTGEHTGYLKGDATINKLQRTMTGYITSELDGDTLSLLDPERIAEDRQNM